MATAGKLPYSALHRESEAILAELLLSDTCHHLAAHSWGELLFHAAGLAWRDKGLLLPGGIGSGKSTLAAWLVTKGLDYLTDDMPILTRWASVSRACCNRRWDEAWQLHIFRAFSCAS